MIKYEELKMEVFYSNCKNIITVSFFGIPELE